MITHLAGRLSWRRAANLLRRRVSTPSSSLAAVAKATAPAEASPSGFPDAEAKAIEAMSEAAQSMATAAQAMSPDMMHTIGPPAAILGAMMFVHWLTTSWFHAQFTRVHEKFENQAKSMENHAKSIEKSIENLAKSMEKSIENLDKSMKHTNDELLHIKVGLMTLGVAPESFGFANFKKEAPTSPPKQSNAAVP